MPEAILRGLEPWLYLVEIGEPSDNCLRIVVVEAGARGAPASPVDGLTGVTPIVPYEKPVGFELIWRDYVAYAVRNESFCVLRPGETRPEHRLATVEKSAFLDFVHAETIATDQFPGPHKHWRLLCLNHVVDVVACSTPEIRAASAPVLREFAANFSAQRVE